MEYVEECRDEIEIINFFKLRGKNLNTNDIYNLKNSYNNFWIQDYNKNRLTLNQLNNVAGGFYIVKKFEKNTNETVYALMLGQVPSFEYKKYLKEKFSVNYNNVDYGEKFADSKFIPLIDMTNKTMDISFIPIRYLSMRTLPVEILQGILNNPVIDMYSATQQKSLYDLFYTLTSYYVGSLSSPFDIQTYTRFISYLCNGNQEPVQKQAICKLLTFKPYMAIS